MLSIQYLSLSHSLEAAPPNMPNFATGHPHRRQLRHYLVGTSEDVRHAIDRLHVLGYLNRISWIQQDVDIPANGFIVYPKPGDVLRYTQRDRSSFT